MLDWLIVGTGPHGVHLAHVLQQRRGMRRSHLRLLHQHANVVACWCMSC